MSICCGTKRRDAVSIQKIAVNCIAEGGCSLVNVAANVIGLRKVVWKNVMQSAGYCSITCVDGDFRF